jgi:hypothetical protein
MATKVQRISAHDPKTVRLRFTSICCDAVGEGASHDIDDFFAEVDRQLFCNDIGANNRDVGLRGDKG